MGLVCGGRQKYSPAHERLFHALRTMALRFYRRRLVKSFIRFLKKSKFSCLEGLSMWGQEKKEKAMWF